MNDGYIIDFTIPQGPTGPTEPSACANMWSTRPFNATFLADNAPLQVNLFGALAGINMVYDFDGELITNFDGGYIFDYSVIIQVPDASPDNVYTVTVGPSINHQEATSSISTTLNIDSSNIYYFNKSTINNLNKGDNVSLVIKSNKVGNFTYSEANMLVNRVSEKFSRIPTTG